MAARLPLYTSVLYNSATAGMISRPKDLQRRDVLGIGHIEDDVLNAQLGQGAALFDHVGRAHLARRQMNGVEGGFLDRGVIPTNRVAVLLQHVQLGAQRIGPHAGKQVAGIGILSHQAQGLLLAGAADQDGRMRLRERLRAVERFGQLVIACRGKARCCPTTSVGRFAALPPAAGSVQRLAGKGTPSPVASRSFQAAPMPR